MAFSLMGIIAVLLEFLRPFLLPLAALLLVELVLLGVLVTQRHALRLRPAARLSAGVGVASGALLALMLPAWTGAGLGQLNGVLDYASLIAAGVGLGVAVACLLYPPLQLLFRRPVTAPVGRPRTLGSVPR